MSRGVALAIFATCVLPALHVRAEVAGPDTEPPVAPSPTYALSWVRAEGAEACPTGRVLVAEVERRLGRRVFDVSAERSFEVEVTHFGSTYRSDVFVRDAAGVVLGHRTLESSEADCTAIANATVLAIALVIDPEAAAREPAAASPSTSAGVLAVSPPPSAPPVVVTPATAPSPAPSSPSVDMRPSPEPYDRVKLSLRGELSGGLVPTTSSGLQLGFTARLAQPWGVAVSAAYTRPQTVKGGIGKIDVGLSRAAALFTFQLGRPEYPLGLILGAGPSVGAYHLAVREPAPVTAPGDYWYLGFELVGALHVLVTKRLFFEIGTEWSVPLRRQSFYVRGQGAAVWEQPSLSGGGFLGVGTMFP